MTEKRFKLDSEVGFIDTQKCGENTMTLFEVVVELNKLNEENEKLRFKNRGLQSELQIFKEDVTHSNLQINKLADENEQLKQSNNGAIELMLDGIVEMHDGKRDYAESIFNKAIKLLKGDVE